MYKIFSMVILLVLLFSCSSEERLIDNSKTNLNLYGATNNGEVYIMNYENKELTNTNILEEFNIPNDRVKKFREFKNKIYVIFETHNFIFVYDKVDPSESFKIDFQNNEVVSDIVFSNVSDAFILFEDKIYVQIYDLVNKKVAGAISLNFPLNHIVAYENKVYVSSTDAAKCFVIDVRTYNKTNELTTGNNISKLLITGLNELLVIENSDESNPAYARYFDLETYNQIELFEIGNNLKSADEILIQDGTITPLDFSFLITNNGMLRLDLRVRNRIFDLNDNIYNQIYYSSQVNGLFLLNESALSLDVADANDGKLIGNLGLPLRTESFLITSK